MRDFFKEYLFFLHFFENLSEKYGDCRNDNKENNFALCWKKYS